MLEVATPLSSITDTDVFDNNQRTINYLRLSVTDRCNFRCIYCMPEKGISFIPHDEILTYEEMLHVINLCVAQGVRKVRLTGGEPLVRKGIIPFIEKLCHLDALEEVTLTTNGVLLKKYARDLYESGISRVNVSMDTLKPDRFRQITRRDYFDQVWDGIKEAASVGLNPVKINIVAMKGVNDDELVDFASLTITEPYHVRFIEMMPFGDSNDWSAEKFLATDEILSMIQQGLGAVKPIDSKPLDGPAQRYTLEGAKGEIGLIGALSNHFCSTCNRLRLTSDGHLKGCLFSEDETDLKTPLRQGRQDPDLMALIRRTILNKPENYGLDIYRHRKCVRPMSRIGG